MQTTCRYIPLYHFVKSRLIDGDDSSQEAVYLFLIDIHTGHIRTHFGEACSRNQADITCSYYCYIHIEFVIFSK